MHPHANTRPSVAETIQRLADKSLIVALAITFAVALLLGVTNGWARGATLPYRLSWAFFAIAVVCVEFGAVKKAVHEWRHGNFGLSALAGTVGVLGLVLSSFATFNSATSNLDQVTAATTAKSNSYADARATHDKAQTKVTDGQKNVAALRAGLAASVPMVGDRPVTTVAAAEQLVKTAKADRYYAMTDSCTNTTGPKTSKFCKELGEASAAIPALTARAKDEASLKEAEAGLAAAEGDLNVAAAAVALAPPVTSKVSPFVRSIHRYTGLENEEADLIEAGLPSVIMQMFLMLLGLISAGAPERIDEEARGSMPRPIAETHTRVVHARPQQPQHVHVAVEQAQTLDPFGLALDRLERTRLRRAVG